MSNELNEKIFRSVDTIVSARLQNLPFDQTIVGVIESVPESLEGAQKYIVNYKGAKLTVFVNEKDKSYALNEEVYVLIPQGNFSSKKLITGRVISDYEVTGKDDSKTFYAANQLFNQSKEIMLIPSSEGRESSKTIMGPQSYINNNELVGYTTLRISYNLMADLYNSTKALNKGVYGIRIILSGKDQTTKELKTFTRQITTISSNKDMLFLSAYKTGGYTSQYFDIDVTNLIINNIQIELWEDGNFYDSDNNKIDSSDSFSIVFKNINLYLGYYKSDFSDITTDSNIGVYLYPRGSNRYQITSSQDKEKRKVIMGFRVVDMTSGALATFTGAEVWLYSYDKDVTENSSVFGQGWWRLGARADGNYDEIPILAGNTISASLRLGDQIFTQSYRIYFKGKIGTKEVLGYSQTCSYINTLYNPDIGLLAGLNLFANNNNNTFYIYGQDNQLLARSDGEKIHYIAVEFNSKDTSKTTTLTNGVRLRYMLPSENTMLIPVETGDINESRYYEFEHILKTDKDAPMYDYLNATTKIYYIPFKINSLYNPLFRNNTIKCEVEINNQIYTSSIELLFGNSGSSGANCVLQLSLQEKIKDQYKDCKVICPIQSDKEYRIVANLYDYTWQGRSDIKLTYEWYYNSLNSNKISLEDNIIKIHEKLTESDINLLSKLVIKVKGTYNNNNLEGYISIPTTFNPEYVCADGCSIVTYDITGKKPVYEKTNYQIFKYTTGMNGFEVVSNGNLTWSLQNNIQNKIREQWKFENNIIIPPTVFSSQDNNSTCLYVQAQNNNTHQIVWIQPIVVIKNNYPIAMWNDLQGADINFNDDTLQLISTTVGQLNSDQTKGVLMGTFKNNNNLEEYGLYAFDNKKNIFKINDQGEAWIKTAALAQNLADANYKTLLNVGSSENPVYFLNGIPVQCDLSLNSTIKTLEQRIKTLENDFTTLQQITIPNLVKRIQALENK